MIRAHFDAILDRLRADPILADVTFDGEVTGDPELYCRVYGDNGGRDAYTLSGEQARATFSYPIHSVGRTREQAQFVAERVFAQLLGFTPTIDGRAAYPIRHAGSQPVSEDKDADPWIHYCVDQFDLTTIPARRANP